MTESSTQRKFQVAWDQMVKLGGQGVAEDDLIIVSLVGSNVTDDDLALFKDFPYVNILELRGTVISDEGLVHLDNLKVESLGLEGTKVSDAAVEAYRRKHPSTTVTTKSKPGPRIDPFTKKTM